MKAIKQAELNDILYSHYNDDEISASKVTELINEKADIFAISFMCWCEENKVWIENYSNKEKITIYKDQK